MEIPGSRYWINQPSKHQQFHKLHGINVIGIQKKDPKITRIYFLSGAVISQDILTNALSEGWNKII